RLLAAMRPGRNEQHRTLALPGRLPMISAVPVRTSGYRTMTVRPEESSVQVEVNGVELAVQTSGRVEDPAVLLVGVSMLSWPAEFCRALTGRRVVRYDPRDVGRSTYVDPDHPDYDLRD